MKKIKKLLLTLFAFATLSSCSAVMSGCDIFPSTTSNTLTFEVQESITIAYGEYCVVPSVVAKDSYGNLYFPTVEVIDSNSQAVIVEKGKFFVLSDQTYTFKYSLKFNGETIIKTTTANVADLTAPIITLSKNSLGGFINRRLEIPDITYSDNVTSQEDLTVNTKVYFGDDEIAVTDNGFTPTQSGTYSIKYSVKDLNNNVAEETLPVLIIDYEEGNVAYWTNPNWKVLTDSSFMLESRVTILTGTGEYAAPNGEKSLGCNIPNDVFTSGCNLTMNNPAIKDISGYQYLYLWLYTTREGGVSVRYNNHFYGTRTNIKQGVWTRVVFERGADGNFYTNGTDFAREGATNRLFAPAGTDQYASTACSTDISSFIVTFQALENVTSGTTCMYFGGMYVCNELPALPDGTVDWVQSPKVSVVDMQSNYLVGTTVQVGYTVTSGDLICRTYLQNGTDKTLLEDGTYTFATAGEYTFVVEAEEEGRVVSSAIQTVNAVERVDGDIAYFTNDKCVELTGLKINSQDAAIKSGALYFGRGEGEQASPMGGSSWKVQAANYYYIWGPTVTINAPAITDVSAYKYLYIWVYTDWATGVQLSFNREVDTGAISNIESKKWTRIVFERGADGNYYANGVDKNGATGKLFGSATTVTATDITGFCFTATNRDNDKVNGWTTIYFGGLYVCNELPELPEGTVEWQGTISTTTPPSEEVKALDVYGVAINWKEYFK